MEAVILIAIGWVLGMVTAATIDRYAYELPMSKFYKSEADKYFKLWLEGVCK